MRKYLQSATTKEIFPYDGPDVASFLSSNKDFKSVNVIHIRNKEDRREAVVASSEWGKTGDDEKDKWDVFEPDKEGKSILQKAFEQGATRAEARQAATDIVEGGGDNNGGTK